MAVLEMFFFSSLLHYYCKFRRERALLATYIFYEHWCRIQRIYLHKFDFFKTSTQVFMIPQKNAENIIILIVRYINLKLFRVLHSRVTKWLYNNETTLLWLFRIHMPRCFLKIAILTEGKYFLKSSMKFNPAMYNY